jgi:hypothetical protein
MFSLPTVLYYIQKSFVVKTNGIACCWFPVFMGEQVTSGPFVQHSRKMFLWADQFREKNVNLRIISKLSIVCIVFQFVRVHARSLTTFVKRLEIRNIELLNRVTSSEVACVNDNLFFSRGRVVG